MWELFNFTMPGPPMLSLTSLSRLSPDLLAGPHAHPPPTASLALTMGVKHSPGATVSGKRTVLSCRSVEAAGLGGWEREGRIGLETT